MSALKSYDTFNRPFDSTPTPTNDISPISDHSTAHSAMNTSLFSSFSPQRVKSPHRVPMIFNNGFGRCYRGKSAGEIDKVNGSTIFEVLEEDEEDSRRRTDRPDIASFDLEGTQSEKKKRLETSLLRAHMRSQSAGNNTVFAIISQSPPSSSKKSKESRKSSNPSNSSNAVKAAKKFLKRLYNSATMPVRGHTKSVDVSTSTTPLFGGVRHPILPISSERCTSCLKVCETGELAEDEGCFVDTDPSQRSSFTPSLEHELSPTTMRTASREDPAEDSLFAKSISSTESHKPSPNNFRSWNEVFDHLRREIATMREKDIEILAELQHVEHQLRSVTKQTRRSSYEVSIDRDKLRPGDHVESMPL